MRRIEVQAGDRYGLLVVVSEGERWVTPGGTVRRRFECRCDCGKTISVGMTNIRNGNTTSCGCSRIKHGMSRSRIYGVWEKIIQRCTNPSATKYCDYGGRGIAVCDRWRLFENFYSDMGECPEGKEIERKDNDGNYEPGNCRWATRYEQTRNTRRNNMLTHDGVTLCVTDWAARLGVHFTTLTARLRNGWSVADTVTTPSLGRGNRRR